LKKTDKIKRIPAIDGLRSIAVLGVLWVHIWSFYDNIPWKVGVDLNRIISFGGNGVDLFFVISGFCMYLMYGSKVKEFSTGSFLNFLKLRWLRIAPAFYVLIVIESLRLLWITGNLPIRQCFYHLLFLNIFIPKNIFSPHYWSLATEFHFYVLFPFIFLFTKNYKQILIRTVILMIICLIIRIFLFKEHQADIALRETISSPEIWYRFIEFGFGIIAAIVFIHYKILPRWISGAKGFIIGLIISYSGRIFMSTDFVNYFGKMAFVFRAFGEPVMTLGFGLMLLNVVTSDNMFSKILSLKPFLFIGKISYSMYLWHFLLALYISEYCKTHFGINLMSMNLCLLLSLSILVMISWISFRLFEAPYFRKTPKSKEMAFVEVF
jgi:peptidoglycan/LPS O-acetylase OafA/YrhL